MCRLFGLTAGTVRVRATLWRMIMRRFKIVAAGPLTWHSFGSPDRIRTGVTALRGRRPRPLDDGAVHGADRIQLSCGAEILA